MKPLNKWSQRELADRYGELKQYEVQLYHVKNEIKRRHEENGTLVFKGIDWLLSLTFRSRQDLDRELLEEELGDLTPYKKPPVEYSVIQCTSTKQAKKAA